MPSHASGPATPGDSRQRDAPLDTRGGEHFGVYVDGIRAADEPTYAVALDRVRELGRGFVWLSLDEPDDHQMNSVADVFDLHPLAVEHVLRGRRRPKVEWYDHLVAVAFKTLPHVDDESDQKTPADGHIALFVGRDFLITCAQGEHEAIAEVRKRAENSPVSEPSAVMHAIADRVVGSYLELAARMRVEADLVEEKVFSRSTDGDIERIYYLKRQIVHMRLSIEPLTHALRQFAAEHGDLMSVELGHSMRDVMEQNIQAVERIVSAEALLESLLESAYGRESTQQNVDMRKIAAWAAMAAVPTTVAGIYGMRFPDMPELHWLWGYPAVLTLMTVVTALLYRTFHRKGWV